MEIKDFSGLIKKIVKKPIRIIKESVLDLRAFYYLKKQKRRKKDDDKVRVGFIVQMAEIWDKEEEIFEKMVQDKRFQVSLFVCPAFDFVKGKVKHTYDESYFFDKYPNAIKLCNNNQWIDLEKYELDYVFYQRPYDDYLPKMYKSFNIVRFSKCCYVPYAFWPLMHDLCGFNKTFFRNAYFAFMESAEHCKEISKNKLSGHVLYKGYPALDHIFQINEYDTDSILWTPRWSYDEKVGGSHFFEYKDEIVKLKKMYDNIKIVIRPHPLAFDNYIRMGLMTETEVIEYKKLVLDAGISFDNHKKIEESFSNTGILITDISSIIFPFFLTGKPIIYCKANVGVSPAFERIMKGLYIADNWEDIITILNGIRNGNDPLKEVRHKLAEEYRKEYHNSAQRIVDTIANDFISENKEYRK